MVVLEMATAVPQTVLPAETKPRSHKTTFHHQSTAPTASDVEKQRTKEPEETTAKQSAFKDLAG